MNLRQILIVGITGAATMPAAMSASAVYRTISKVAAVAVDCPQGTVPRLPNLVWVTYSDGYSEYQIGRAHV